jgi:hypothetical protein
MRGQHRGQIIAIEIDVDEINIRRDAAQHRFAKML